MVVQFHMTCLSPACRVIHLCAVVSYSIALCKCHCSIVYVGSIYHVETDCTECLNGGTFLGESCDCPMGFSGTYCEVEGVLFKSHLPYETVTHVPSFNYVHPSQTMNHTSPVTAPATMATVTTPVVDASAIPSTLETTATRL